MCMSAFAGCADNSSSKTEGSSSKTDGSSSLSDSSSVNNKPNAIGYDVNNSKRLYDGLKEDYAQSGYDLTMKSTASGGSELRLCVKNGKIYSSNKNSISNQLRIYTGGSTATIYDHNLKTYVEQAVSDPKKLVASSDLLFGMTGDFMQAQIDEQNNVINEYYRINSDVSGSTGVICFCFRGDSGKFIQITIQYDDQNFPIMFGITDLKTCDDSIFDSAKQYNYSKQT